MRSKLLENISQLPDTLHLPHPGYLAKGCKTPKYLSILSNFKVAICSSSRYGYALRKIIEASCCGCRVITDLPTDERLPHIDDNLIRVSPQESVESIASIVREAIDSYDPAFQEYIANIGKDYYDWRAMSWRLDGDIKLQQTQYYLQGL